MGNGTGAHETVRSYDADGARGGGAKRSRVRAEAATEARGQDRKVEMDEKVIASMWTSVGDVMLGVAVPVCADHDMILPCL